MRLHDLAKKLGVSSKELMGACRKEGFEVKSHFKGATPEMIFAMNKVFGSRTAQKVDSEVLDTVPVRKKKKAADKAAPAKEKAAAKSKTAKKETARKPVRPQPKKTKKKEVVKDLEIPAGEDGEEKKEFKIDIDHHAHRHKRADFKVHHKPSMPAEPKISNRYEGYIYDGGGRSGGGRKRRGRRKKPNAKMLAARAEAMEGMDSNVDPEVLAQRKAQEAKDQIVELTPPITLRELSSQLGVKLDQIIKFLISQGVMANINDVLSEDVIELIALDNDKEVKFVKTKDVEEVFVEEFKERKEVDPSKQVGRPPVIAFLGHVDHGKTSLLDKVRKSRVVDTESGGITQHIGAYRVPVGDGMLCFLDTPGHEAFSSMRARGANLTDIVVLVVAADDGVMPQTREAFAHAKAAGVPIVVAINKCDVPNANVQKAMQELSSVDESLLTEEWGGSIGMIQCSAITGEGIDELVERIQLEAEMLELKCNNEMPAEGHVLEAELTSDRGVIANILIKDGTLNRGDIVLCGTGFGKVKLMFDENGKTIHTAGAATPVSISGLSELPEAGDDFYVVEDLHKARQIAEKRQESARTERLSAKTHVSLENLTEYLKSTEINELKVVLKADVMGTLEVLKKTMNDLATDEVKINIIHSGVGGVNQADIILADASDAIIVGFHVAADSSAKQQAEDRGVDIRIYHVIYHMVENLKAGLSGLLAPEEKEKIQGHAEIRQVFKVSRLGNIGGCFVTDGIITRAGNVRVFRDNVMIYEGKLDNLQRFKDQVREVREGYECGMKVKGYDNIQIGDVIESYITEEFARTLE
ncbi:MAG: translation initiation factor IF-2 [Planctomycetota bacterium]|jgi:translation initiation factor IF-2